MGFYIILGYTLYALLLVSEHLMKNVPIRGHRYSRNPSIPFVTITFVVAILTIVAGIRWNVGTDYPTYLDLYSKVDKKSLQTSIAKIPQDFGFVFFQYILKNVFSNNLVIFFATSFFTVFALFCGLIKSNVRISDGFFVYYFLGFYIQSFNSVRQSLAVSLIFLGYCLRISAVKLSYFFAAVAFTIHASSFLAWIFLLLTGKKKFTKQKILIILATSVLSFALLSFGPLLKFASVFNPRYGNYLQGQGAGFGTQLNIIFNLVFLLGLIFLAKDYVPYQLVNYIVLSISCLIVALSFVTVGRLQAYFSIFYVILIPIVLQRHRPISRIVIFLILTIYFGFFASRYNDVVPFRTWLDL